MPAGGFSQDEENDEQRQKGDDDDDGRGHEDKVKGRNVRAGSREGSRSKTGEVTFPDNFLRPGRGKTGSADGGGGRGAQLGGLLHHLIQLGTNVLRSLLRPAAPAGSAMRWKWVGRTFAEHLLAAGREGGRTSARRSTVSALRVTSPSRSRVSISPVMVARVTPARSASSAGVCSALVGYPLYLEEA